MPAPAQIVQSQNSGARRGHNDIDRMRDYRDCQTLNVQPSFVPIAYVRGTEFIDNAIGHRFKADPGLALTTSILRFELLTMGVAVLLTFAVTFMLIVAVTFMF